MLQAVEVNSKIAGSYGMLFDKVSFKVDASARYLDGLKN